MLEIARPGFLWAGALLAALPLLLHLIRPRIRERRELPTTRFLAEDPSSRLRVHRRPDHLPLLLLRMLFAALLGAAFAGLSWIGPGEGTATLVVVDGGAAGDADAAEARARELAGENGTVVVAGAGDVRVRMADLLTELRRAGGGMTGVDSVEAVILTDGRPELWGPGLPDLRDAVWPGAIRIETRWGSGEADGRDAPGAGREPAVLAPGGALPAELAGRIERAWTSLPPGSRTDPSGVVERVEFDLIGGDGDPRWRNGAPEEEDEADRDEGRELLLLDGRRLPGGGRTVPGEAADGVVVPLLRGGGIPAGAAELRDGVCHLGFALAPDAPVFAGPDLPLLLEAVAAAGCGMAPTPSAEGTEWMLRTLLEEGDRPTALAVEDLREPGSAGRLLTPWLLILALAAGAVEWFRTRRLDRRSTP